MRLERKPPFRPREREIDGRLAIGIGFGAILGYLIAGANSLPRDLQLAASNLGLRRLLWWRRLALPAIFPAYVTGAVTAATLFFSGGGLVVSTGATIVGGMPASFGGMIGGLAAS